MLKTILDWARKAVDACLNGLLLSRYVAAQGHYIGRRRECDPLDFSAIDGVVFIMLYDMNMVCTHEVPHNTRSTGLRVSVTLRAFVL